MRSARRGQARVEYASTLQVHATRIFVRRAPAGDGTVALSSHQSWEQRDRKAVMYIVVVSSDSQAPPKFSPRRRSERVHGPFSFAVLRGRFSTLLKPSFTLSSIVCRDTIQ